MDHHQRALDLFKMLYLEKSRELAIQLAQHSRATLLTEHMMKADNERNNTINEVTCEPVSIPQGEETQNNPTQSQSEARKKTRLYMDDQEDDLSYSFGSFNTQPSQSTQSQQQPKANPFSRETTKPKQEDTKKENYVNLMEKLMK